MFRSARTEALVSLGGNLTFPLADAASTPLVAAGPGLLSRDIDEETPLIDEDHS